MAHEEHRAQFDREQRIRIATHEQDGLARLGHDVVTLPPDQVALGLVEAILEQAEFDEEIPEVLSIKLMLVKDNAVRLKVLLEGQIAQEKRRDQFEKELRP